MKIALQSGTSGLVGMQLLHQLIQTQEFDYVISVGRRKLALKHSKLIQLDGDLGKIDSWDWREKITSQTLGGEYNDLVDALGNGKAEVYAFCSIGTTIKQAGSQDKFYQVDHDLVIGFAKWAKSLGATRFVYISSMGADANSSVFYSRLKGEVESDLRTLGFDYLALLRPSLLLGHRHEFRLGEELMKIVSKPLVWLKLFKNIRPIFDHQVARSMVKVAMESNRKGTEIIPSGVIQDLSK
ncbi:oxidoreductase [Algoriphagus sp. CAU 1675]|uniref:oxidoreductase n=1 Tax=Algoriphagus sp. CAU 1675 TaxID=3032597 RepID=UPI0023DA4B53|nr:oxidoreductase [Algoriphagus sp. CAU 1675]MDF2158382.1 oxidoreductase [Algoriphagus sp. CAU 1675]